MVNGSRATTPQRELSTACARWEVHSSRHQLPFRWGDFFVSQSSKIALKLPSSILRSTTEKKTKYVNKKKSIFKKVKEKHKSQCPWRWLGRDLGQGKWPSPRPRPLPVYNLSPSPLQSLTAQWVCKLPEDSKSVWVLWT